MPIATRAVGDLLVAALIASLDVTAERRRTTGRNRSQRLLLLMRERGAKPGQVSRAVEAENVAQLQRRRRHRAGLGSVASGSRSSGLTVVRMARLETCRYLAVVLRLRCPSSIWMRCRSISSSNRWVVKQWRKVWGEMRLERCAALPACRQMRKTASRVIGCSAGLTGKSQTVGR